MPIDPSLARETLLDALQVSTHAGASALGGGVREVATAASRTVAHAHGIFQADPIYVNILQ